MLSDRIVQAGDGTFLVTGTHTNWVILADGDDVTLIDAGYPGDYNTLLASLDALGHRPQSVRAVLVTHAHVDHIGSLPRLTRTYATPVLLHPAEVAHAKREYLQQCGPLAIATNIWRPGLLGWTRDILAAGATSDIGLPTATPFAGVAGEPLDLPGAPVPIATPGHTSGHCAYLLPGVGAVATGDTLVTAHPTSRVDGPQLLLPMFNHDEATTVATLDRLAELEADTLLPGHGPLWRGSMHTATDTARRRG
ncbi:glyoxylase-like metal-dependent hydrolase (beta-lactamase superfamily II) [Jatrophihabitans sp. GAS493]|uniref:MBL fold metallo-hydrolase n=1 Tax=Jatrophihabitans sp. GAS493 TaxID=1907575 RepID=UPI000BB9A23F|nr:MBL fold metallo-hydrolase [Jatrophihabitans sp. GAS493]SOD73395.1 glyoxylase-like metal-dependent hydrolase (beta-lactamase superfamily II) [Jatrophihabitans sp. GAS493]